MHSNYLKTDGFDGPNGTGDDFVAGGRVSTPTLCHRHRLLHSPVCPTCRCPPVGARIMCVDSCQHAQCSRVHLELSLTRGRARG